MTQETKANQGKGAIFDLDGTLLDSMGVWDQVDVDFLAKRGIEVPDDYMQKVAAMQFRQIAEYTIARFGLSDTPEALMEEWDHMARVMYATVVEAKPYAREYLESLKASGAKLAVATSLPPMLREPAMKHVGIFDYFDDVVSVDDAGDVGKTEPDVYLLAASRLGIKPSDCTVFEICWSACARPSRSACMCGPCTTIPPTPTGLRSAIWPTASCSTSTTRPSYCNGLHHRLMFPGHCVIRPLHAFMTPIRSISC